VIYNNSKNKIKRLYHQPSSTDIDFEKTKIDDYIIKHTWEFLMCLSKDSFIFISPRHGPEKYFVILNDKIEYLENCNCDSFSAGHSNWITKPSNNSKFNYQIKDSSFEIGKVNIRYIDDICSDTEHSEVEIWCSEGEIKIFGTRNVSIFEFDLDRNGTKEMIIFSYHSCSRKVDIYKVY
jgi:hypothetical protein